MRWTIVNSVLAGTMLCVNATMGIFYRSASADTVYPIAAACVAGGVILDFAQRENKYEKLFRQCGLVNSAGQIPLVMKKTKGESETTLVIHMPDGISQKHFETKQQELEQALFAKIEFSYNRNLIMKLTTISLGSYYKYEYKECKKPLEICFGQTHSGRFNLDIEKAPHILMAGETGSGKSSGIDTIALSLIFNDSPIELHLIDFQNLTLGKYQECKKVKSFGYTPESFDKLLDYLAEENERRLKLFTSKRRVYIDKLETWNELYPDKAMPYIVVIVDEIGRLAEDRYKDYLEKFRTRVSMDRKVGIHYIIAVQRPDVKMIEGAIKANFPVRIAYKAVSEIDSRVTLDEPGAEKLDRKGRCLIKYCGKLHEVQTLYANPKTEVNKLIKQHKAYKSRDELASEKYEQMKALRRKCINPYLKGDAI